jgi:hypothetical protein
MLRRTVSDSTESEVVQVVLDNLSLVFGQVEEVVTLRPLVIQQPARVQVRD